MTVTVLAVYFEQKTNVLSDEKFQIATLHRHYANFPSQIASQMTHVRVHYSCRYRILVDRLPLLRFLRITASGFISVAN
jgi:hypothetical protein